MVGYPGAAPGWSWSQTKRVRWLSRIRFEKWTCAPDSHQVMWTCKPPARRLRRAHELKWFPQPDPPRHRFVHNEECCSYTMKEVLKWSLRWVSHPHGPVYETGAFLRRPRRSLKRVRHVGAAPTRSAWKADMLAVTSMPHLKWSLELVARQPLRIFNPPLICLSHPALISKNGPSAW